jgi:predicted Zn-dependent protease
MNNKERIELARWAAGESKKAGADDASVIISYDRTVSVEYRDKKIDNLSEATQNSLSLSIYLGGRFSNHTTCDLRKDTLGGFIEQAVAMTKFLTPDRCEVLSGVAASGPQTPRPVLFGRHRGGASAPGQRVRGGRPGAE